MAGAQVLPQAAGLRPPGSRLVRLLQRLGEFAQDGEEARVQHVEREAGAAHVVRHPVDEGLLGELVEHAVGVALPLEPPGGAHQPGIELGGQATLRVRAAQVALVVAGDDREVQGLGRVVLGVIEHRGGERVGGLLAAVAALRAGVPGAQEAVAELPARRQPQVPVGERHVAVRRPHRVQAQSARAGPKAPLARGVAHQPVLHVQVDGVDRRLPERVEHRVGAGEAAAALGGVAVCAHAGGVQPYRLVGAAHHHLQVAELLVLEGLPDLGAGAHQVAVAIAELVGQRHDAPGHQHRAVGHLHHGAGRPFQVQPWKAEHLPAEVEDEIGRAHPLPRVVAGPVGAPLQDGRLASRRQGVAGAIDAGVLQPQVRLHRQPLGDLDVGRHARQLDDLALLDHAGGVLVDFLQHRRLPRLQVRPRRHLLGDHLRRLPGVVVEAGRAPVRRIGARVVHLGHAHGDADQADVAPPALCRAHPPRAIGAQGGPRAVAGFGVEMDEQPGAGVARVVVLAAVVVGQHRDRIAPGLQDRGHVVGVVGLPARVAARRSPAQIGTVDVEDVAVLGGDRQAGAARRRRQPEAAAGHQEAVERVALVAVPDEAPAPVAGVAAAVGDRVSGHRCLPRGAAPGRPSANGARV